MSIRRRGNGYQVRVAPFPEQTLPNEKAAILVEANLKQRKALGELYQEPATTFGRELEARLERKKAMGGRRGKLRPATVRFNEQCVRPWEPLFDVLVPNLRRSMVEDHIAGRAGVAPTAARNELQFAKAALRDAESRGQRVDRGIFSIDAISVEAAEGVALTLDRLDELASFMPEHVKRIVPLTGTLGLRWSEASGLTDSMLRLDEQLLVIPRDLNKSRREKPVPLSATETRLLREQLLARKPGAAFVFANQRGGRYAESGFRNMWKPALLAAGLAHKRALQPGEVVKRERDLIVADFHFHWLRHTAASLMAAAGMDPSVAALRLGHNDGGSLFLKRYRHLYPSEMAQAVARMDAQQAALREAREA